MEPSQFRLDRTAFRMGTHATIGNQYEYWKDKSIEERLRAATYLISVAYNYPFNNPPRLDRTVFSMRKHTL